MVLVRCFVLFSVLLPERVRSASVERRVNASRMR
jgi:hypothetical protein